MKKYIVILFLFAFCFTIAEAQTKTRALKTTTGGLMEYTAGATDSVNLGETSTYTVLADIPWTYWYNMKYKFTSVSTTQATIVLAGKYFSTDTPTTITTVTINTAADSVITFQQITTKQSYRYYTLTVTPVGAGSQIFTKYFKVNCKQ